MSAPGENTAPGANPGQVRANAQGAESSPTRAPEIESDLQDEIAKLRNAIMRTIVVLDRFSATVSEANTRVREMSLVGEEPQEQPRHGPDNEVHTQGEDKWYDTRADK